MPAPSRASVACLLLVSAALFACAGRHRSAEPESVDVSEDFDQQQYATTSPAGDGSETSSGYFGASGGSSDPEHRVATPSLGSTGRSTGRRPAQPGAESRSSRHEPY